LLSFWEKDVWSNHYDIVIIGAGFAGSWLAYELLENNPKLKLIILERGILPQGASTKNAGFACFGSPSEMIENIKEVGIAKTMELTSKRYRGVQKIQELFGKQIDFNDCPSFELFDDKDDFDQTLTHLEMLNANIKDSLGIENHFLPNNDTVSSNNFSGFKYAIENGQEGSIHSMKLLDELHKNIISKGGKLYFNVNVDSFEEKPSEVLIFTDVFGTIKTRHLSICTNAFTKSLLPDIKVIPGRGQMLVTKPIPGLKLNGTFHFDKGYFYFRNYQERILFGGGRNLDFLTEKTEVFGENRFLINTLKNYLKTHILPNTPFEIDQTWSGIMAFNSEKEPISKVVSPRLSYNVCMNGMGVALTPTLAEELAIKIKTYFHEI
jgi:gamma-glutamylputrescine oxidase